MIQARGKPCKRQMISRSGGDRDQMRDEEAGALGLVVCLATKIVGQAEFAQRPNQPFRRIEIIPSNAIAIIALIHMMIVVVTLPKREQRNPPTIST